MSDNNQNNQNDDLDMDELDNLDIPDADIEYQQQDDSGCEGGACKI